MNLNIKSKGFITYLICIFIIISPLVTISFSKSPYEIPKFIISLIVAQILAFLLIFQKLNLTKNKLQVIILLFVLVNFIADILGLDPRVSLLGGEYRFQGFLLLIAGFILALSSNALTNKTIIYKSIVFSSIALSLLALFQFIMLKTGQTIPSYNGRIVATLGNPNFVGAYLAMALPFILCLNLKNKLLKIFLIMLIIFSALASFSLSAILAISVILIIFTFKNFSKYGKKVQITSVATLIILILIIIFSFKNSIYRYSQWDNRFSIWNAGISSIIKKPLLGVGQENFELIFPREMHYKVDNAHNIFIEIAVSSGLMGLSVYIFIIYLSFKKADFEQKLALLAFLIAGFFNPLPIVCINLFWILIGLSNFERRG